MPALDDYLERVGRELQASPEEAAEVLREVRSHLELAMRDLERNGGDGSAGLAQALARFGAAEQIGRELRQVHGRSAWQETILAVLPLLLFGWLPSVLPAPAWSAPLALAVATLVGWRARWPLWWWAWLGWLPLVIPGAPGDLLWSAVAYAVLLLLVSRRDWLEATLAIYPLPTAWAFQRVVLASNEVGNVGWSSTVLSLLGLGMALAWAVLLARTLRTPYGKARIAKALEGQAIVFLLNGLTVVVARLWPTYPYPYPFTWRYFAFVTLPYATFSSLPFLLLFILTSLPAILALVQRMSTSRRAGRRPPSRPAWGG